MTRLPGAVQTAGGILARSAWATEHPFKTVTKIHCSPPTLWVLLNSGDGRRTTLLPGSACWVGWFVRSTQRCLSTAVSTSASGGGSQLGFCAVSFFSLWSVWASFSSSIPHTWTALLIEMSLALKGIFNGMFSMLICVGQRSRARSSLGMSTVRYTTLRGTYVSERFIKYELH